MSRNITPSRMANRPPFNGSTSLQQGRSVTPPVAQRRTSSPTVNQQPRRRTESSNSGRTSFNRQSSSTGQPSSVPADPTHINGLVSDLVNISHHLKHYVSEHNVAAGSVPNPALRAEEVERIVRRVELHCQEKSSAVIAELEAHYKAQIATLEQTVQEQKDIIVQMMKERNNADTRLALPNPAVSKEGTPRPLQYNAASGPFVDPIRNGIAMRTQALSELERTWESDSGSSRPQSARDGELQQLRQILLAEKRQRLLVEEQTQSLTEQHSKVVTTLESRIRKQEKQMQQLMESFEQHNQLLDVDNRGGTPRSSKFRQRALAATKGQESGDTPRTVRSNHTPRDYIEVGLSSSRDNSPVAAMPQQHQQLPQQQLQEQRALSDPTPAPSLSAVDDVTEFLENIAKELESISNTEEQRKMKIASLA